MPSCYLAKLYSKSRNHSICDLIAPRVGLMPHGWCGKQTWRESQDRQEPSTCTLPLSHLVRQLTTNPWSGWLSSSRPPWAANHTVWHQCSFLGFHFRSKSLMVCEKFHLDHRPRVATLIVTKNSRLHCWCLLLIDQMKLMITENSFHYGDKTKLKN